MNKEEQTKQAKEKKQIKKEVQIRIKKGEPKQQILEELSQQYKDKITIVKQLESTPSMVMKWKYLNYNHVMSFLLLAIFILDGVILYQQQIEPNAYAAFWVTAFPFLNLAVDVLLLIGVLRYRIETYSWIAVRAIISLLQIVITHAYYNLPIDWLIWGVLFLLVVSFLLGLFLGVKLCPPRVPKTIEVNIDENEKINKTIYVFPD